MNIIVTGCAGFIGFHLSKKLAALGHDILGIDNLSDYYDVNLKYGRLLELGVAQDLIFENTIVNSNNFDNLRFVKLDIAEYGSLKKVVETRKYDIIIHLAAQAGVRYSLEQPFSYVRSNLVGFSNILEICRQHSVGHLIYASSSSVYGNTKKIPFNEIDKVDNPISLYAATKKSNELMAHAYSHLYGFQTTGLRFFTVYGPWGRPDMAPMLFAKAISEGEKINVFNNGEMKRDFTYVDDVIEGIVKCVGYKNKSQPPYKIFNIGNSHPIQLMDFINILEEVLHKEAKKEFLPMQPGDVKETYADTSSLTNETGYAPKTDLKEGLINFVLWYKEYYGI
ncbi:MAG: NAD-dependent epimerase/dehydratase family protein [Bacteroidota bacterium]